MIILTCIDPNAAKPQPKVRPDARLVLAILGKSSQENKNIGYE
jgi:hypothetical protein